MLLTFPQGDAQITLDAVLLGAWERTHPPINNPELRGPARLPHALLTLIIEAQNHITRVQSGRLQTDTLDAGDTMLILPKTEFHARFAAHRRIKVVNLLFEVRPQDDAWLPQLFPDVGRADEDTAGLRYAMQNCSRALADGDVATARLEFAASLLSLARLNLARERGTLSPPVRRALDFICRHPEAPLTRDDIARAAGVTPSHLSHLVRRQTGVMLCSHIQNARIARARDMIHETSCNFSEIARALNMDLPHFSRLFKQVVGISPRDYARSSRLGVGPDVSLISAQSDK